MIATADVIVVGAGLAGLTARPDLPDRPGPE
jgi:succinate dehydrogenase/fumarate reductase flavoprotein subunit